MTTSTELRIAIRILETFKEIDPDITLPSMIAFLYYVESDGRAGNQYDMEQRLDMSTATASRATAHWLSFKRPKVPGLGMLESIPDPEDRRYRMITLNRKGEQFANKIKEAVKHGTKAGV